MAPRLIINADDFGLTPGINRAILELHRVGALTSATLMATGPAFDDAVAIARANPSFGVGCHIVLTDGVPVSPPDRIPTLIGPDRKSFRLLLANFVFDLLAGRISEEDIMREVFAQFMRIHQAGLRITHADTHKHTHLFPQVARYVLAALERIQSPAIRNPFEPAFTRSLAHAGLKRRTQIALLNNFRSRFNKLPQISSGTIATTSGTVGISATGNLNATTLMQILDALPPEGTYELVCHPGYNDRDLASIPTRLREHRETELEALASIIPARLSQPNAPTLIHYGSLKPAHVTATP